MPGTYFIPIERIFLNLSGGTVTGQTSFSDSLYAFEFSATTIFSGSSNLYDIFSNTTVQPGLNIYTGGTVDLPTINISAATLSYLSAVTIAGGILYSGETNLYDIFGSVNTRIQPGINTYTGGTIDNVSVNISGGTFDFINVSGNTNLNNLNIADNKITLNYNPEAPTISNSLGSGFIIQDGVGISGNNVFFDIRGTASTIYDRAFATNLDGIRIRESGSTSNPNGLYLLSEGDILDAGFF